MNMDTKIRKDCLKLVDEWLKLIDPNLPMTELQKVQREVYKQCGSELLSVVANNAISQIQDAIEIIEKGSNGK